MSRLKEMQEAKNILREKRLLVFTVLLIMSRIPCVFFSPHGVNCDEAALDYNIFCISEFGIDRYGNPFPVYFANQLSGQSALYTYLGALLVKVIGFSVEKCRLIKLAAEIVTLVFGGKLAERFSGGRGRDIFCFLYIICPYFYRMAGISFDCDLVIPVYVLCMYLAERCMENGGRKRYLALGFTVGLLSYSYIIGVLMVPLFLLAHFLLDRNKKGVLLEAAVAFVTDLPIGWYVLTILGAAPEIRTDYFTIAAVSRERLSDLGFSLDNIWRLKYAFVMDPDFDFAGSARFGTVYYISLLFIAVGLVVLLRKRMLRKRLFLYFAAGTLPLLFIRDATTYNYTILYFFLLLFAAAGLEALFQEYKTLFAAAAAAYVVMFGFFLVEYYTEELYIYADDSLIPVMEEIGGEEKVMLDTTGVIFPECYIGIARREHPGAIRYDAWNNALSFGNIQFNDAEGYLEYDTAILRDNVQYLYQPTSHGGHSGLGGEQVRALAEEYLRAGYQEEKQERYYIYKRRMGEE